VGAADGDHAVLHRLSQHLEHGLTELRKLVEEEDAAMAQCQLCRQAYLGHTSPTATLVVMGTSS